MSDSKKVLIILSSSSHITIEKTTGGTEQKETGFFLKELAQPLTHIIDAGYTPIFANPKGSKPHMDPLSDSALWYLGSSATKEKEKQLLSSNDAFNKPRTLSSIDDSELASFRGVFIPGGHAPMEDLGADKDVARILKHFHEHKKPTAVICHGPIALLSPHTNVPGEDFIYRGYKVACYSNIEEKSNELLWGGKLRKCEDALREAGLEVQTAMLPLTEKVVVDRELVSGENPTSAAGLGKKFVEMLEMSTN